jgi:hypothetical protein
MLRLLDAATGSNDREIDSIDDVKLTTATDKDGRKNADDRDYDRHDLTAEGTYLNAYTY